MPTKIFLPSLLQSLFKTLATSAPKTQFYLRGSVLSSIIRGESLRPHQDLDFIASSEHELYKVQFFKSPYINNLYTREYHFDESIIKIDCYVTTFNPEKATLSEVCDFHDLTISSLYCNANGELFDPSGNGIYHLLQRELHTIHTEPAKSFKDPICVLRVLVEKTRGPCNFSTSIEESLKGLSFPQIGTKIEHIYAFTAKKLSSMSLSEQDVFIEMLNQYGLLQKLFGVSENFEVAQFRAMIHATQKKYVKPAPNNTNISDDLWQRPALLMNVNFAYFIDAENQWKHNDIKKTLRALSMIIVLPTEEEHQLDNYRICVFEIFGLRILNWLNRIYNTTLLSALSNDEKFSFIKDICGMGLVIHFFLNQQYLSRQKLNMELEQILNKVSALLFPISSTIHSAAYLTSDDDSGLTTVADDFSLVNEDNDTTSDLSSQDDNSQLTTEVSAPQKITTKTANFFAILAEDSSDDEADEVEISSNTLHHTRKKNNRKKKQKKRLAQKNKLQTITNIFERNKESEIEFIDCLLQCILHKHLSQKQFNEAEWKLQAAFAVLHEQNYSKNIGGKLIGFCRSLCQCRHLQTKNFLDKTLALINDYFDYIVKKLDNNLNEKDHAISIQNRINQEMEMALLNFKKIGTSNISISMYFALVTFFFVLQSLLINSFNNNKNTPSFTMQIVKLLIAGLTADYICKKSSPLQICGAFFDRTHSIEDFPNSDFQRKRLDTL